MKRMSARPRVPRLLIAGMSAASLVVIVLVLAISRPPATAPSVVIPSPQATASPGERVATPAATLSSPSATQTATAPMAVQLDARYGLIVATGNMRTETDPRGLQDPSLFMINPSYAVSPDGRRVSLIRTGQTGQHVVTFSATGRTT